MTCRLCCTYLTNTAFEKISKEIHECAAFLKSQTEFPLRVFPASSNFHYTEIKYTDY